MPYTLAHPIATAPFWYLSRRRLDLSALTVGSMVPDISYFIALKPVGNIGHTWQGILLQGIPAGLVLLALFYGIIAKPLHRLLSSLGLEQVPHYQSLGSQGYRFWPLPQLLTIIISLTLGACSHILWDSFTHHHGWFVDRLPLLQSEALGLPLYKLLQYGGGILGLIAIALWYGYEQGHKPLLSDKAPRLSRRSQSFAISLIAVFTLEGSAVAITLHRTANDAITTTIVTAVTGATSGLSLGLLFYGISDRVTSFQRNRLN